MIGAIILVAADWLGSKRRQIEQVGPWTSLAVGFSQALALLPGISRSGATISTGLALGLTRESAARFSFLLATPITLGAGLYGSHATCSIRPTPPPSGWRSPADSPPRRSLECWRSASCSPGFGAARS